MHVRTLNEQILRVSSDSQQNSQVGSHNRWKSHVSNSSTCCPNTKHMENVKICLSDETMADEEKG